MFDPLSKIVSVLQKIQEVNGILVRSDWILDPKKVSITINEDE